MHQLTPRARAGKRLLLSQIGDNFFASLWSAVLLWPIGENVEILILKNIDVIIIKDQGDNVTMQRYDNKDYLLRSLCLLKLGEGEAALQDVQMAINAGYPEENRFKLLSC